LLCLVAVILTVGISHIFAKFQVIKLLENEGVPEIPSNIRKQRHIQGLQRVVALNATATEHAFTKTKKKKDAWK
jgi:hypothetical protein